MDRLVEHGFRETVPFDGRVALRVRRVEQFAVLDEQQALHEQLRCGVELVVQALGEARREQRLAAVVEDVEAGARLFVVRGEQAHVGQFQHLGRHASLFDDDVVARLELGQVVWQVGIAEALVVRAGLREADRVARAFGHAVVELLGQAGEEVRFERRRAALVDGQAGRARDGEQQQDEERALDLAPAALGRRRLRLGRRIRPGPAGVDGGREAGVQAGLHARRHIADREILLGSHGGNAGQCRLARRSLAKDAAQRAGEETGPSLTANTIHDGSTGLKHACKSRQPARHPAAGRFE
ncbi:conserved hypothetical protein [Ricinus communis]|uniref:Uncharacterized protein n=1 Tax=Ricinus communis TaxID=3988 RepID=B9TGS6_RICCO|nr:conserved hypothetical protein [Ricinus communis]